MNSIARNYYEQSLEEIDIALRSLDRRNLRLVWIRSTLFVIGLSSLIMGYTSQDNRTILQLAGWMAAAGFFIAIVWHEQIRIRLESLKSDQQLYRRLLARLDRRWDDLPNQTLMPEFHSNFADDLDVSGGASLLQLLSLAVTLPGRRTLQSWIVEPAQWRDVLQRQKAVKAMREQRTMRMQVIKTTLASSDGSEDVYRLPRWAEQPRWLPQHRFAHLLSYIGPALFGLGLACLIIGLTGYQGLQNFGVYGILAGLVINLLVTVFWGSWVHEIFLHVTGHHRAVYSFAEVFESFSNLPRDEGMLEEIRSVCVEQETSAVDGFRKLLTVVRLANLQRDPTLYLLVYLPLQLTLLWDFRVLQALEKWQARFGPCVKDWFDALGRYEAIISGATLADEYPEWTFPVALTANPNRSPDDGCENVALVAKQLGHPLLSDQQRVPNDLEISKQLPLVLVTGSNMAGKSTFMRAIGLNELLARTGAPVCASHYASPLFELATSIRVRDSLKDGVSFFMAELKRLKEVVDLAQARAGSPHAVLFLLDEILQGTNSRERQIAVISVLETLLSYQALGLISTHDLDLAAQPEIQRVSQIVHFREFFESVEGQQQMRFDFKMRPGPTPTTNALKLLELAGLKTKKP